MSSDTEAEARAVVARLGGQWHGSYGLCRCPAHNDRNPSLRIAPGETRLLVHCFAGCAREDVLRLLPVIDREAVARHRAAQRRNHQSGLSEGFIQRLWGEGRAVGGTLAERYLANRGICSNSRALRFHPRMFAGPRAQGVSFPALLAAVETDEGVVALQRTFLGADGRKAPIVGPRRTLGSPAKGAVRLAPADAAGRLGLAEGVETALSAAAQHGIPVWATGGSEGFAKASLPERVTELHLFLDNGPGGDRAEALVRARGLAVRLLVHRPPAGVGDWNDLDQARVRGRLAHPAC